MRQTEGVAGKSSWSWLIGTAVMFVFLCPLMLLALVWRFDQPSPVVKSSVSIANPAGTWIAVVERIDAMDVNAGELNVVHVVRRGVVTDEHGNQSKTMIFYADADATEPLPRA